jgi:hypothetical protein
MERINIGPLSLAVYKANLARLLWIWIGSWCLTLSILRNRREPPFQYEYGTEISPLYRQKYIWIRLWWIELEWRKFNKKPGLSIKDYDDWQAKLDSVYPLTS